MSEVLEQLESLEKSVGVLTESINELETRLVSVLHDPKPKPITDENKEARKVNVPLVAQLEALNTKMSAENHQLNSILLRMAL